LSGAIRTPPRNRVPRFRPSLKGRVGPRGRGIGGFDKAHLFVPASECAPGGCESQCPSEFFRPPPSPSRASARQAGWRALRRTQACSAGGALPNARRSVLSGPRPRAPDGRPLPCGLGRPPLGPAPGSRSYCRRASLTRASRDVRDRRPCPAARFARRVILAAVVPSGDASRAPPPRSA
jgi:hypothetical protein